LDIGFPGVVVNGPIVFVTGENVACQRAAAGAGSAHDLAARQRQSPE